MSKVPGIFLTPSETASINEFLNSQVGKKWLGVLLTLKPTIDLSSTEKAALSGAFAAGYESFFAEIALTRVTRSQPDNASAKGIDPTKD